MKAIQSFTYLKGTISRKDGEDEDVNARFAFTQLN